MDPQHQPLSRSTPVSERPLAGSLLVFREHEVRSLLDLEMRSKSVGERDTITLWKSDDMSLLRVALRQGGRLPSHKLDGPFTLIVLSGSVKLLAGDREEILNALDVAACRPGVEHTVEALEAAHVMITMAGAGHASRDA